MFLECLITKVLGRKTDKVVGSQLKNIYYEHQIRDFVFRMPPHSQKSREAHGKR
jgi:hypothetical protein